MIKKIISYVISSVIMLNICFASLCVSADGIELPDLVENSWRYDNGELITENDSIALFADYTAWSKTENGFINSSGDIIQGATYKGIDVSSHQSNIDWEKVKNTDVDYAIIRCGYGDNYEKYDDTYWKYNADQCTELNIPFGAYLYSYAASIQEAESEAEHAIRLLSGYDLAYPVYLDLEDSTVGSCSNEMIGQIAEIFCNRLQEAGYMVGIYANLNWWRTKLTSNVFQNETWYKWVAQYNSTCTYSGNYTMWQSTSSGSVNGIAGNVDIDFWYGDMPKKSENTSNDYSYPNTYTNTGDYAADIVGVAETQVGYTELTSKSGSPIIDSAMPYYTKYGERYGNANAHWCAFFVLWCAEQAGVPTSIICKSSSCGSCGNFVTWFKNNHRWRDNTYTPKKGDVVFFDWDNDGYANHVGIVQGTNGTNVLTIEGNTGGENGYAVMKCERINNILGYGVPDYELKNKINGYAIAKQTAYMLPDSSSQTVWEIWNGDELQVLCSDGDYYLVLYPYVYTGKFVSAYVPKSAVQLNSEVKNASEYYNISKDGVVNKVSEIYHNASTDDLIGTQNNKVRATLNKDEKVKVLFEDGDFLFIKNDLVTGYIEKSNVSYSSENPDNIYGDINGDFVVNSADAGLILRYDVGIITLDEQMLSWGDVNSDGIVDSADAGLILRYDAGIIGGLR